MSLAELEKWVRREYEYRHLELEYVVSEEYTEDPPDDGTDEEYAALRSQNVTIKAFEVWDTCADSIPEGWQGAEMCYQSSASTWDEAAARVLDLIRHEHGEEIRAR